MTEKERISLLLDLMDEAYPNVKCSLNYSNPLEMLIATQLSAQCTDARVNIVTEKLFKRYKTVYDYASADEEELREYIRSAGFYKNKAKNIIKCCTQLIERHGGNVPGTMEELTALAGTGRKTANLVLGDIFHKPAVVVDTHCIRLSNRIGLVNDKDPVKIEYALKKIIPPERQLKLCHQFVYHGRECCRARKPGCEECKIAAACKKIGITSPPKQKKEM